MMQDRFDEHVRSDTTRAGMERDVTSRLVHLGEAADLQVADGDPDIRGWDVRTADGERIGKVKDLIVDTGLMKVRYIEAQIDKNVLDASDDRHVLIPIGSARLDDDEDDVYLSSSVVDPRTLPPYDRNALSRDYEVSLRERFPRAADIGTNPAMSSSETLADRRESANYIGPAPDDVMRRRNEGR